MSTQRTTGLLLGCSIFLLAGFLVVFGSAWLIGGSLSGAPALTSGSGVGLVRVEGPITESRYIVAELDEHRRDPAIKSVVLRLDSPGGEVAPSQEIYDAVRRLAEQKPVVASFGSVAASGAYYIAVAADSIVTDPGSLTGSIGVIFSYPTFEGLMEKVGVEMQVFKSGELKDMGSFARTPTEAESEVLNGMVQDVYDQFISAVVAGRPLDRDEVLALADGRVFSGRQAVEARLADRLGDLRSAADLAAAMAGLAPDPELHRKERYRWPILGWLDPLLEDTARADWGPRLEYRLR